MHSLSLSQETQSTLQQQQQLLINLAMKQAFHVMQLPLLELAEWLKGEIENNPVLELDLSKEPFKERLGKPAPEYHALRSRSQDQWEKRHREDRESRLVASVSLYEHLMSQAPLELEERGDIHLAEQIIGHLNEKGFLDLPLEEISSGTPMEKMENILKVVQTFDPPGIGARDLKESLLLQLKFKGKEDSRAAEILSNHFEDLIHNRLPLIAQKLHMAIGELIQIVEKEISPLTLNPGYFFCSQAAVAIIPDLLLLETQGKWEIAANTSFLPKFHISALYSETLQGSSDRSGDYFYLRRQLAGGRWLRRIVHKRNHTLVQIGAFLLKKQKGFFEGETGALVPLTMKEAADALEINESTVARAVAGKYIACSQGMFALRSFFSQGVQKRNGEKISSHSIREMLANTIEKEDKCAPLSDEALATHFNKIGIPCARRTITKYRSLLRIPPACKRRKWG